MSINRDSGLPNEIGTEILPIISTFDPLKLRKAMGLTREEFCARTGMSVDTLRKWERTKNPVAPRFDEDFQRVFSMWIRWQLKDTSAAVARTVAELLMASPAGSMHSGEAHKDDIDK